MRLNVLSQVVPVCAYATSPLHSMYFQLAFKFNMRANSAYLVLLVVECSVEETHEDEKNARGRALLRAYTFRRVRFFL